MLVFFYDVGFLVCTLSWEVCETYSSLFLIGDVADVRVSWRSCRFDVDSDVSAEAGVRSALAAQKVRFA